MAAIPRRTQIAHVALIASALAVDTLVRGSGSAVFYVIPLVYALVSLDRRTTVVGAIVSTALILLLSAIGLATASEITARVMVVGTLWVTWAIGVRFSPVHPSKTLSNDPRERLESRLATLLKVTPDAIIGVDDLGRITVTNPQSEKLFRYSRDDLYGKSVEKLLPTLFEEDHLGRRTFFLATPETREMGSGLEMKAHPKDGGPFWVDVAASPFYVGADQHVLLFVRSIEERRRARELELRSQAAERANAAKSEFLAHLSHEIRTPMNAILGFAQLLRRSPTLDDGDQQKLATINRAGEHLLTLINDVLDMAKIEAGRLDVTRQTFDVREVLNDVEGLFQFRIEQKGLTLRSELDESLASGVVTDQVKVRQILVNVLGNAVKFTTEGRVTLRAAISTSDDGSAELVVDVEDTGAGIAADELPKVFEEFEQTESGTEARTGTGLGMPLSRRLARLLGGDLTITSTVGRGTTVRLRIPVETVHFEALVESTKSIRPVTALAPEQHGTRVLVADDHEDNRTLLRELLVPLGFEVREVANGQEAITVFEAWSPQIVLMDIRMPVMDGREATRRIKALPSGADVPVIALSAGAFDEERDDVLATGADDFLRKPFKEEHLLETIRQHLHLRYEYAEEEVIPEPRRPSRVHSMSVAEVPSALRAKLREATTRGDIDELGKLIEQVETYDMDAASTLAQLASKYDYDALRRLLDAG